MTLTYYQMISTDSFPEPQASGRQYYLSTPKSYEHSQTVKQKRIRKVHPKVRTGCLTCKARRKKCDEAKPACLACTSTGRQCEGYTSDLKRQVSPADPKEAIAVRSKPQLPGPSHREHINECGDVIDALWTPAVTPEKAHQVCAFDVVSNVSDMAYVDSFISSEHIRFIDEGGIDNFMARSDGLNKIPISPLSSSSTVSKSPGKRIRTTSRERSLELRHVLPNQTNTMQNMLITPSRYTQLTDLERHCFSFFRYQTAPSFASYFNYSIFRNHIIQTALENPVVLSCAAALGAVHRRHEHGISREAFEYCTHAASLHKKALKELLQYKATSIQRNGVIKSPCRDTIAISEILLSLFESFQGEHEKTVEHVYNGMKYLLEKPMVLAHRDSHYCVVGPASNIFLRLFQRLDRSAYQLFDASPRILARHNDGRSLPSIPSVFASLEEARDYVFTELSWIRNIPRWKWLDPNTRLDMQRLHVRRISQWGVSYAETVKGIAGTPKSNRACKMIKLARTTTNLILYLMVSVHLEQNPLPLHTNGSGISHLRDEDYYQPYTVDMLWQLISTREELVANLTSLNIMAESTLDENHTFHYEEHSLSLDSAIGPPKRAEIAPESSAKVRHMVKYFNTKQSADPELWSSLGMYGIAEKWSSVEEHAVINAIKAIIPETVNPKWVDISWMMESRKLLLRYCRPDELGLVWTQEWWTF